MATSPGSPATIENIPRDVLSNIFIRLLAKQLAQMRCICKSWNALLSESSFVKSHLHHSVRNNDEILLFFANGCSFDSSSFVARSSRTPGLPLTDFIKLPVNSKADYTYGSVIGSVNGLICFSSGFSRKAVIYIWNPSLSAVLALPPYSLPSCKIRFGFGFDPKADDYKVIKLKESFQPPNMEPLGEVYSMRKGYWESISQSFPSHIKELICPDRVCVDGHDGHLHWLCSTDLKSKRLTIVAFNLSEQTFREIPLPDSVVYYDHRGSHYNVLGVLAGKLCVMMSSFQHRECEVWVMEEYGVPDSWVKHHAFPNGFTSTYKFRGGISPYGFTSHNKFLFQIADNNLHDNSHHFGLFDLIKIKTIVFKIVLRTYAISTVIEYVDSLVWITPTTDHNCEKASVRRENTRSHSDLDMWSRLAPYVLRLFGRRGIVNGDRLAG